MPHPLVHPQTYVLLKGKQPAKYYQTEELRKQKASEILSVVERYYNVSPEKLKSKSRKGELVIARQIAIYLIKIKTRLSDGAIAEFFKRDRTTVIYSVRTIENFLKIGNPELIVDQVDELKRVLSNI